MPIIIDHDHHAYRYRWQGASANRYNGAFYYSKEIVKNIIPRVKTNRNWITINVRGEGCDHAIVFIHNNLNPENYDWLKKYNDLILVCGIPETCGKVAHLGTPIYLPLSIDVDYVRQFWKPQVEKRHATAYVGRRAKVENIKLPVGIDYLCAMKRQELLEKLADYKQVYAVGRCAIEAKALGCEVLPYDPRFPDPSIWKVHDNSEAAALLQYELDKIDLGD